MSQPSTSRTVEAQYEDCLTVDEVHGRAKFGVMSNQVWHDDPKRLVFVLSRYKFVAKMLAGRKKVLEVGCADAFGTRIVQAEVGRVTALDMDPLFIADAKDNLDPAWRVNLDVHDMLEGPYPGPFDAAYSLDVLEHIERKDETRFLANIAASLTEQGTLIIGMPSLSSQDHASPQSKIGHINCKHAPDLKALLERFFHNVFIFSMNDEVVHTGFYPMSHYYFALCCGKRDR
jgi:cyclopropane fatty-acyl-phospholipid synthase-like methyltransferase